ncbi:Protein CBG25095 [Caenorhabditis briggsae]|uniref:Protein CBG25095 n=1 Tax=Caenorhabditis briggsae TaxID=6238 RepID=A8WM37_CAEBR|nr:Protein CBG25095 [Caenorhabditis briggsae]CAP21540.1 Protein CBG25095 [Caenorhabditis briggsae]
MLKISKIIILILLVFTSTVVSDNYTCNACGQRVYGTYLPNDVQTLITFVELMSTVKFFELFCTTTVQATFYLSVEDCTNYIVTPFSFFYRIFYAVAFPFRDYYCRPFCDGGTGEDYELVL